MYMRRTIKDKLVVSSLAGLILFGGCTHSPPAYNFQNELVSPNAVGYSVPANEESLKIHKKESDSKFLEFLGNLGALLYWIRF